MTFAMEVGEEKMANKTDILFEKKILIPNESVSHVLVIVIEVN